MTSFLALIKKEAIEQIRTRKLIILAFVFLIFGIMNPIIAKMTPWLLDVLSDSLAESGMIIEQATVTSLDAWVQFYKNIPMCLIVFVLLESGILTSEIKSSAIVLSLTKGLRRSKVVLSKSIILASLWTVCYLLYFVASYFITGAFWSDSLAQNTVFSAVCFWLLGIWVIALVILFSVLSSSNITVLLGVGGTVLAVYLVSLIPKVDKVLPIKLSDGVSLIYGLNGSGEYITSIVVAILTALIFIAVSIPIFNKKQI